VISKLELRKSKLASLRRVPWTVTPFSQPARLAKRRHGKKHKQQRHGDGDGDEPASGISRPGAKRSIEPAKRKDGKNRSDGFVKQLPQGAPEPPETAWSLRRSGRAYGRGHESILTQNEADDRKRDERTCSPGA